MGIVWSEKRDEERVDKEKGKDCNLHQQVEAKTWRNDDGWRKDERIWECEHWRYIRWPRYNIEKGRRRNGFFLSLTAVSDKDACVSYQKPLTASNEDFSIFTIQISTSGIFYSLQILFYFTVSIPFNQNSIFFWDTFFHFIIASIITVIKIYHLDPIIDFNTF